MSIDEETRKSLSEAWEKAKAKEISKLNQIHTNNANQSDTPISNKPIHEENAIPLRQILGLSGSTILFIGIFCPIISIPIVGNVNYFRNGKGDGVFILILAVISVLLTLTKRYRGLLFTGLGSLAFLAFSYIFFQWRMSETRSNLSTDNPFSGIGEALIDSVELQWGFAVMILGASLLIAASIIKKGRG